MYPFESIVFFGLFTFGWCKQTWISLSYLRSSWARRLTRLKHSCLPSFSVFFLQLSFSMLSLKSNPWKHIKSWRILEGWCASNKVVCKIKKLDILPYYDNFLRNVSFTINLWTSIVFFKYIFSYYIISLKCTFNFIHLHQCTTIN